MKLKSPWRVKPDSEVKLRDCPTRADEGYSEEQAEAALDKHRKRLAERQEVLYAEGRRSVLIVLQGMDTAGKDGTISHVFSGVNPQGCQVTSFKVPTPLELRHDFLWRCHAAAPPAGTIGIFNRSHYEDVLAPRVHKQIDRKTVRERLQSILDFERLLTERGTLVLKFFLHISPAEQKERLQARLDDPDKLWKFSEGDLKERAFWDRYQDAYEDLLGTTSTRACPWFVVPSDRKWFRNLAISGIVADAMDGMDLAYPKPTVDPATIQL